MLAFCITRVEVLAEIKRLELPGLTVPRDVLQSGRKSFTLHANQEELKHLSVDQKVKSIEVKFYPYPVSNNILFAGEFCTRTHPTRSKYTFDLRHNAGYYVKFVQPTCATVLEAHGMRADKSNGTSIAMRKCGIKSGWLCCNCVNY